MNNIIYRKIYNNIDLLLYIFLFLSNHIFIKNNIPCCFIDFISILKVLLSLDLTRIKHSVVI